MSIIEPTRFDADEENTNNFDPLVPRAIDLPTLLPLGGAIDPDIGDIAKVFAAPENPGDWPAWRASLVTWREGARDRLGYSGAAYDDPATAWTSSTYSVALVWLWDERLFDHTEQRFTPREFLAGAENLGGFDAVVLWHAYPVIGIDDRNQFDFYRLVPGIRELVEAFTAEGLHVFVDYNPWDTGTRRAPNDDPEELGLLVTELGVDGVFLDTLKEGDAALTAALRHRTPPQVLEGESRIPLARIEDHQLSWAQWFADSRAPGVLRAHWYERRHMMHHTRRWNRDHSDELQSSWMNGTGMLVWDTVFGVWVGWNARDRETLRRMLRVQRALSRVFVDGDWAPLADVASGAIAGDVYASRFDTPDLTIWTIVNRGKHEYRGPVLDGPALGRGLFFELGSTSAIEPTGTVTVPARGISPVIRVPTLTPELRRLLEGTAIRATDTTFPAREAVRVVPDRSTGTPPGDAILPTPGRQTLEVTYRRRETGRYQGAPYIEEWKPLPPRLHDERSETHEVELDAVAIAAREVTNAEFADFLAATGAEPRAFADPDGPAVDLDLAEARAYAAWRGARLPNEFEWQAAASEAGFGRLKPLVWNWTESEHSDGVTRWAMLKGGSDYRAEGSDWYFDGGPQRPEFSAKLLLMGLGMSRSPNVGFRLAWDVEQGGAG